MTEPQAWNPEHSAIAKQGSAAVEAWRAVQPDSVLELSGADLQGISLVDAHLTKARLRGARLRGAKLAGAQLSGADLEGADLSFADLHGALLLGARLRGAVLIGANLEGAQMMNADLVGGVLRSARLEKANLSSATLYRAVLEKARLERARLANANLEEVNFSQADCSGTDFSHARLRRANLSDALLEGADFRGARDFVLDGHDLTGVRFSARSRDPWSTLRRRYTGTMTAFHVILATIACAPLLVRAFFSYSPTTAEHLRIAVISGWAESRFAFGMTTIIVGFNILRIIFTHQLSQLREEEQRSGHAPARDDYWHFWIVDRWVMRWAEVVVSGLALWRTGSWLLQPAGLHR